MDAKEYFGNASGSGYLATSNAKGEVNIAPYSRPLVQENGQFVFGMTDRLTHANLQENNQAVYAFMEERGYNGKRFYLKVFKEDNTGPLLEQLRGMADKCVHPGAGKAVKYVVHFTVTKELPLMCTECAGDHTQHLCEIAGNERFDLIKELAKQPDFICTNCGRTANKEENLCSPMLISDLPAPY